MIGPHSFSCVIFCLLQHKIFSININSSIDCDSACANTLATLFNNGACGFLVVTSTEHSDDSAADKAIFYFFCKLGEAHYRSCWSNLTRVYTIF